jgi:WhiB family redox-sensing transcriptional regulator
MTAGTNWRDDAACLDADPDLFFPVGTTGPALDQTDQAKRICQACPVRKRCLAWALELGAAAGIWGGTTEDERRALRRAAARHRNRGRKVAFMSNPGAGCADHQDQMRPANNPDRTMECPPGHDERLDVTRHG